MCAGRERQRRGQAHALRVHLFCCSALGLDLLARNNTDGTIAQDFLRECRIGNYSGQPETKAHARALPRRQNEMDTEDISEIQQAEEVHFGQGRVEGQAIIPPVSGRKTRSKKGSPPPQSVQDDVTNVQQQSPAPPRSALGQMSAH